MTAARYLPLNDYLALKASVRSLVRSCGGPNAAAGITRSDAPRLSRYGAAEEAMHAPLDVIADLEAEAGVPEVTRVLAGFLGYVLVPKPKPAARGGVSIGDVGALAKEAGEAITFLGSALGAPEPLSAAKCRKMGLRRELREAMEVLARIDSALETLEDGR
ncbi:hypothetical protein [Oleispirillum naphthae]|uniref:hypothetical protein n=1 Tax=Oleispirillum naphthae TaxID=2838853 RepID=UPI0030826B71